MDCPAPGNGLAIMIVIGTLKPASSGPYDGYRVEATYDVQLSGFPNGLNGTGRVGATPTASGEFSLSVPDKDARVGPPTIAVWDPVGTELVTLTPDEAELDSPMEINIPEGRFVAMVSAADDPALGRVVRYQGRVLDHAGEGCPAGLLVVLWGVPIDASDSHEPEAVPLDVATTTAGGYLFGTWPTLRLNRGFVRLAGGDPQEVTLNKDRFPVAFAVVVDELPAAPAQEDGCDCGPDVPRAPESSELALDNTVYARDPGRCVDFAVPNRTIEEVTYQVVVRTTQPALRGSPPPSPPKLAPELLAKLAELAKAAAVPSGVWAPMEFTNRTRPRMSGAPASQVLTTLLGNRDVAEEVVSRASALLGGIDLNRTSVDLPSAEDLAGEAIARRDLKKAPPQLERSVLADLAREPDRLTPLRLVTAEITSAVRRFRDGVEQLTGYKPARFDLGDSNQVEWDDLPLAHQATTIAHGHLLTFKQVWKADGYSLGDLLYSVPLAPGQQKLISVLDWERRESVARSAGRRTGEQLAATATHDRDISDVIRSVVSEHLDGESSADVAGGAAGLGGFVGPFVVGGMGGFAGASSTASQTSGREVAGSALNQVRDRTLQAASAVRSQRTSVVQTARQGDSVRAQTEVIVNYNHCHAMTVEYFEVLRHLQVRQELHQVQECLFVPLEITPFSRSKALRWRHELEPIIRRAVLRRAFSAIERVDTNWVDADLPIGVHADEPIRHIEGELRLRMLLPRPADEDDGSLDVGAWGSYQPFLWDTAENIWTRYLSAVSPSRRNRVWDSSIAPGIAQRLIQGLTLNIVRDDGTASALTVDTAQVSAFAQDTPMLVGVRVESGSIGGVTRREVARLRLGLPAATPSAARTTLHSGTFRYRTDFLTGDLVAERRFLNDLAVGDDVEMTTPLTRQEKQNPRENDRRLSDELLEHLDEHIEYYHRAIWMRMDPNRRYLLLDGFLAPDAGGRSVASVVENRVVGIVGNSIVLPLRRGAKLDPSYDFADDGVDDLRHLYADGAAPPMRISLPTRGVFAEAVLGKCNSCEQIDNSRFWRFEEEPIPDSPTAIAALSTDSRRRAAPNLTPDAFPTGVAQLPGIGTVPDPTGLSAAMKTLGTAELFRSITGLALNQANSASALKLAISTAQGFAKQAGSFAQQRFMNRELDRSTARVKDARDRGLITAEQAQQLAERAFRTAIGDPQPKPQSAPSISAISKAFDRASTAAQGGSITINRPEGSVSVRTGDEASTGSLAVTIEPPLDPMLQKSPLVCWAAAGAMMFGWINRKSMAVEDALDAIGGPWRTKFDADEALTAAEVRSFATALGLREDRSVGSTPAAIARSLSVHGPLWVVTDDDFGDGNKLVHARIAVGLRGDGDPERTTMSLADPATGTVIAERVTTFAARLAANEAIEFGLGMFHY